MKVLASLVLGCSILFGMGADTVESLHICKNTKTGSTYLVTVSDNETEGRAIWIDNYDQLVGENTNSILLPIHYKATFKHTTEISKFMKVHFGAPSCVKVSYEEVQKEIDNQTEELTGQKAFR
jgi:hypothetical protein